MKKITFFSTTILLSVLAAGGGVEALAADSISYTSNGLVEFKTSTDPTRPVDPTDPTNPKPVDPIDPTDPNGKPQPGTSGPLSIDFASSIDFGQQNITSSDKTYDAAAQKFVTADGTTKTGPNYVQVTDNRGTEAGWNLSVKQNGQFKTASEKTLNGATISFTNGHIVTASESGKPTGADHMEIVPDAEQPVMTAAKGTGAGTFLMDWGSNDDSAAHSIHLSVPGKTTKYADKYNSTFTWTLTDTPANTTPNPGS